MADARRRQREPTPAIWRAMRALLTRRCARPARWRCRMFRTELKNWTKGASSPVSEADIAVNDLLEKRLRVGHAGLWLAVGRKRRRRRAARQAAGLDRRSDRRHPRLSRRPRRLVRQRGAGRGRLAGAGGGVRAGHATSFSLPRAGGGATLQRCAGACDARHRAGFFPHRRPEAAGRAAEPRRRARSSFIRGSDRWRCGCAGSREGSSMRPLPAAKAATGTLPRPI